MPTNGRRLMKFSPSRGEMSSGMSEMSSEMSEVSAGEVGIDVLLDEDDDFDIGTEV
jgi:hypothetical protein